MPKFSEIEDAYVEIKKNYDPEMGHITDEELDTYRKFSDHEKAIIKEAYSKYPKGTFPNPGCALY